MGDGGEGGAAGAGRASGSVRTPRRRARGRLGILVVLAMLVGLLVAVAPSPSSGAEPPAESSPPPLPDEPPLPPGRSGEALEVKLASGTDIDAVLDLLPPDLGAMVVESRPLFELPPGQLDRLQAEAAIGAAASARPGGVPDLRSWFRVELTDDADAETLIRALRTIPTIASAQGIPLPVPPPAVTPDFTALQGYVGPATDGIDATFSSTLPGGNGSGITVYDIEYSWNQDHEDLSKAAAVSPLVNPGDVGVDPFDDNHGTAVLGQLIADNDSKGVTGASWGADVGIAPANTAVLGYNPANAIALAAADASPGDIILIEQQTRVCGLGGTLYGPLEWLQTVFDAIQVAVASGVVVVQAAGNGSVDLDQPGCLGRFDRSVRDSGAIIVGAGAAPGITDRQRLSFSSYGSRVDVQGWGRSVATTGYGGLYVDPDDPGNRDRWYTSTFGGTSSASPIVTAAAANLQGIVKASTGTVLTSRQIRSILVETGSPQLGDTSEKIGPRPDLRRAIPAASRLTVLPSPCLLYDSTSASGGLSGPIPANTARTVQVTGNLPGVQGAGTGQCVPAGSTAVIYTISAIDPQGAGNLRLSPAGVAASGGVVNYLDNGFDNANTVTVPLGASGQADIFANASATGVRLVAVGYYSPSGSLRYNPITPCAAADSRPNQNPTGGFVGPFAAGTAYPDIDVVGTFPAGQGGGNAGCGVPAGADAVVVNLVAVRPPGGFGGSGSLAVGPGGSNPSEATTPFADLTLNNATSAVVPLEGGQTIAVDVESVSGSPSSHIRVVVLGYLDTTGSDYQAVNPCPAFDTRADQNPSGGFAGLRADQSATVYTITGTIPAAQGGGGGDCGVPSGASAVLINLVSIAANAPGNFRAYATGTSPTGGILNFAAETPPINNSNAVVVPLSAAGQLTLFTNAPLNNGGATTHARGVILGYFT